MVKRRKRKTMYGNPYTGFKSKSKTKIIESLQQMGKGNKIIETHKVHTDRVVYHWLSGTGKLKKKIDLSKLSKKQLSKIDLPS